MMRLGPLFWRLMSAVVIVFAVAVPLGLLIRHPEGSFAWDEQVTKRLNDYALDHEWTLTPLKATSYVLHAWVFRAMALGLAVWLMFRKAWAVALWVGVTIAAAGFLGLALKVLVDRERPDLEQPIQHFESGSFPSGHALTTMAGVIVVVLILLPLIGPRSRWAVWIVAIAVSVASGLCRVALGVHYLSDVMAGWILGAIVVLVTTAAFESARRAEGKRPLQPASEGVEPAALP